MVNFLSNIIVFIIKTIIYSVFIIAVIVYLCYTIIKSVFSKKYSCDKECLLYEYCHGCGDCEKLNIQEKQENVLI